MSNKIEKTEAEWKKTPEQYYIQRDKGTERALTGKWTEMRNPGEPQPIGLRLHVNSAALQRRRKSRYSLE